MLYLARLCLLHSHMELEQVHPLQASDSKMIPETDSNPDNLGALIEELRTVFASKPHDPPLGWVGLRAFESEHNITLPEPYRTFVAEIANGCESGPPEYGLVPLSMLADPAESQERKLDKPFPLTTGSWQLWEDSRPDEELEALFSSVKDHGSIMLGNDGCGMFWHLIVTGEHRGHVWLIVEEGAVPFGAPFDFTTGDVGFAGWLLHWASGKGWDD